MSKQRPRRLAADPDSYQHLSEMNAGYEQVIASLAAFHRDSAFDRKQLQVLSDRAQEARASSNAYLTGALQTAALAEAGRYFKRRVRRERREERGH
jgi:hypothetical protein